MEWDYWKWLFRGINGQMGLAKFFDRWMIVHAILAFLGAKFITVPLQEVSTTLMLPFASIFIGLSFALAGNAQTLLLSKELRKLFNQHPDGLKNYLYTFQTSILILLVLLIGWGAAGFGMFSIANAYHMQFSVKVVLYFLSSVALRECWHVVLGSQILVLYKYFLEELSDGSDSTQEK